FFDDRPRIEVAGKDVLEFKAGGDDAGATIRQTVYANLFLVQRDHAVDEQHDREALAKHGGQMAAGFAHADNRDIDDRAYLAQHWIWQRTHRIRIESLSLRRPAGRDPLIAVDPIGVAVRDI